jgi:hypothetical protein
MAESIKQGIAVNPFDIVFLMFDPFGIVLKNVTFFCGITCPNINRGIPKDPEANTIKALLLQTQNIIIEMN